MTMIDQTRKRSYPIRDQIRSTLMVLKVGEIRYVGPIRSANSLSDAVAKAKKRGDIPATAEFSITKWYAVHNKGQEIDPDLFQIYRIK